MVAADTWTQAVRQQLGLGRLLPLGGPEDGAWITEQAAVRVLSRAALDVDGVSVETMRIGPARTEPLGEPAVPPPASALPPGPLRIEADFSAAMTRPLAESAEGLRSALLTAAEVRLGLPAVEADLQVTGLLEDLPAAAARLRAELRFMAGDQEATTGGRQGGAAEAGHRSPGPVLVRDPAVELAGVAADVPGVARLAPVLGGLSRPVGVAYREPTGWHVTVQVAVAAGHRSLDVTRTLRAALAEAAAGDAPGPVTVAVLITSAEFR
ncbi:hypothetical protein ABT112_26400 [Streptomyces sp. NPDC002055]|uniref:hypothetical protein n=1 Tax=Streptomyces sp. NPDC002055 TaxID=3154534 RepID=UPI003332B1F1